MHTAIRSRPYPIVVILPGLLTTVATDITGNWLRLSDPFRLGNIQAVLKVAPTGSAIIFDILRSTDSGASFSTIIASPKVTLPIGQRVVDLTPTWIFPTLSAGDILRIDLTQADSALIAANVSFTIFPT